MLGFTAFSQTPLSQSATALFAQAFMPGTAAQFSTGDLLYEAIANHILASVSASNNVNILFDAQASTAVSDVIASFSINGLLDVDAQASVTPSAATATGVVNDTTVVALATITPQSVSAVIQNVSFADVDAKANIGITGVSLNLNNFVFLDEDAQATATLTGLSMSGTVNLDTPTAVVFPYGDYADEYARQRTLFIGNQDRNTTVHIV